MRKEGENKSQVGPISTIILWQLDFFSLLCKFNGLCPLRQCLSVHQMCECECVCECVCVCTHIWLCILYKHSPIKAKSYPRKQLSSNASISSFISKQVQLCLVFSCFVLLLHTMYKHNPICNKQMLNNCTTCRIWTFYQAVTSGVWSVIVKWFPPLIASDPSVWNIGNKSFLFFFLFWHLAHSVYIFDIHLYIKNKNFKKSGCCEIIILKDIY